MVADYPVSGGMGFAAKASAIGNDQPSTSLDVYGAQRTDWIPGTANAHLTVPVRGPGEVLSLNFSGRPAVDRNVLDVYIVNSDWSPDFAAALHNNGLNKVTFVAPGTTIPVLSLPWVGLDRIVITLPPVVAEAVRNGGFAALASALTVTGLKSGAVAFDASFDSTTGALGLNFIGGLATDFYTVTLPGAASNALGITGRGDAIVQFAVQPGDVNNDGRTNDLDYLKAW